MAEQADRVAIITVHGVADQLPGQTVVELARLLCHGGSGTPRYVEAEVGQILIPVAALPKWTETPAVAEANAHSEQQIRPGRPSDFFARQDEASRDPRAPFSGDLGLTLTDYLLGRYHPAERDALYASTRISLQRHENRMPVDVYEMYWADYSRLEPGGIRAISAAYQLMFHLGTLGRDVVDQVVLATKEHPIPGLVWLQRLHAWCAWLLKGPAALLQLAMLLLVPFGAAAFVPEELQEPILTIGGTVAALALVGLALLAGQRKSGAAARMRAAFPIAFGALGCVAIVTAAMQSERFDFVYFGAAAVLMIVTGALLLLRYSKTVRGVRLVGVAALLYAVTTLLLCAQNGYAGEPLYEWMLTAALNAGECVFAALLSAMAVLVVVQIAALLMSFWSARNGTVEVKASLITARIGMVISTSMFSILSLLLWSVIAYVVGLAMTDLYYKPVLFGAGYPSADNFFGDQIRDVGRLFTPLVVLAAVVSGIAIAALAPSLHEEISPRADEQDSDWTLRLGRWLAGARRLLGTAFGVVVPVFGIVGGVLYLMFFEKKLFGVANALDEMGEFLSGDVLLTTGKWLAGGAVTITALGARFTQTFGKLRVALDAMLDVDSYFQDPIDRKPPRAQIFSRFAALLDYVRSCGYARAVIVSHSQGTVISADLLRYLRHTGRLHRFAGAMPLSFVTVGSPLRDLYASRFPILYRWMGEPLDVPGREGPFAADLEVVEWINAYRSGDYVGRSIWTASTDPAMFRVATVSNGRVEASRDGAQTEFCLGAGAHTHYFTNDATALAVEIDRLVCGKAAMDVEIDTLVCGEANRTGAPA